MRTTTSTHDFSPAKITIDRYERNGTCWLDIKVISEDESYQEHTYFVGSKEKLDAVVIVADKGTEARLKTAEACVRMLRHLCSHVEERFGATWFTKDCRKAVVEHEKTQGFDN